MKKSKREDRSMYNLDKRFDYRKSRGKGWKKYFTRAYLGSFLCGPGVSIIRVLSITAGGRHAWCETDFGKIRKPIGAIPAVLMDEYYADLFENTAQV
jgi:hypothetical protein